MKTRKTRPGPMYRQSVSAVPFAATAPAPKSNPPAPDQQSTEPPPYCDPPTPP